LFEDQNDTIKLTILVSNVVDKATQEKIDVVKGRLIRNYGYNEESATDVLTFVASLMFFLSLFVRKNDPRAPGPAAAE
jgi:serine protein kinase